MTARRGNLRLPAELDGRLRRLERLVARLADEIGVDVDDLDTEASAGVRHGYASTYREWKALVGDLIEEVDR